MGSSIYIFLLSSALRISVEKNLITSTKLWAGMPTKLISTRKQNSKEESKLTLVDSMNIVWQCVTLSPVLMVVPDNVARKVPIVLRICESCPYCQPRFDSRLGEYTTCISGHDPRTNDYVICAV